MGATCQGRGLVKEVTRKGNDLGTAHGVVAFAFFSAIGFGNDIRAVQRIVQAAPAGIGGVQGVAGVQNGHDQLGACDFG